MKEGIQIYVICFLIPREMTKIVFLLVTLSGICAVGAQQDPGPGNAFQENNMLQQQMKGRDTVPVTKPTAVIYPNPAVNRIEIRIAGFDPGFVLVKISDQAGKALREDKRMVVGGNEIIDLMFSLKPGIYFLSVKQGKKQARTKLLVR